METEHAAMTAPAGVVSVTTFTTKKHMANWAREHAGSPGISWSVQHGPGGTMLVIEHDRDRRDFPAPAGPAAAVPVPAGITVPGFAAPQVRAWAP